MGSQAALPAAGAATNVTLGASGALSAPANSYPFGIGGVGEWSPNAGFIYKNVPAFQLKAGDTIGFDTVDQNDVDAQLEIALAATTVNGGDVPAGVYTTVVPNTQTPQNPRGDTVLGSYELRFTAQAPFNFPGGGLIVRFSNPSATFDADGSSSAMIPGGINSTDASGFFVKRFFSDADAAPPYTGSDPTDMAPVQFTIADTPVPAPKGKCKKKKKKGKSAAAAKKKKCKKKKRR